MDKFIVWVDNCIVETTSTREKARYYADAWNETLPNIEIKIEEV
jgi:hypothetical protein